MNHQISNARRFVTVPLALTAVAAVGFSVRCAAAPLASREPTACRALAATVLPNTQITSASWVPAGAPIVAGLTQARITDQPAHCLVQGEVDHHVGQDGQAYGDRFELRLPLDWNGRFLFQGGGGLDGFLLPALGLVSGRAALAIAERARARFRGHLDRRWS